MTTSRSGSILLRILYSMLLLRTHRLLRSLNCPPILASPSSPPPNPEKIEIFLLVCDRLSLPPFQTQTQQTCRLHSCGDRPRCGHSAPSTQNLVVFGFCPNTLWDGRTSEPQALGPFLANPSFPSAAWNLLGRISLVTRTSKLAKAPIRRTTVHDGHSSSPHFHRPRRGSRDIYRTLYSVSCSVPWISAVHTADPGLFGSSRRSRFGGSGRSATLRLHCSARVFCLDKPRNPRLTRSTTINPTPSDIGKDLAKRNGPPRACRYCHGGGTNGCHRRLTRLLPPRCRHGTATARRLASPITFHHDKLTRLLLLLHDSLDRLGQHSLRAA